MIKDNILKVRERIVAVCAKCGRDPASIIIVAVTKNRQVKDMREVLDAGLTDIGENRIQEALEKIEQLRSAGCELRAHMVGHLQSNKAKQAVKIFDLIHSVDSLALAREIDRQAAMINKAQQVLIEVNTSGEAAKFGLKPDEAAEVIKEISKLKNINVKGLMTIAPIVDNPEQARPYFKMLRELRDEVCGLGALSMGMTDDFESAIEEGATMVRIGRAIFD